MKPGAAPPSGGKASSGGTDLVGSVADDIVRMVASVLEEDPLDGVGMEELKSAIQFVRARRLEGSAGACDAMGCPAAVCEECAVCGTPSEPRKQPACADCPECPDVSTPPADCPVCSPAQPPVLPPADPTALPPSPSMLADDGAASAAATPVAMPAVAWARQRILAYQAGHMDAGRLASRMPTLTQMEPYEGDAAFADTADLAARGVLLSPFYAFSGRYTVHVAPAMAAWVASGAPAASTPAQGEWIARPMGSVSPPGGGGGGPFAGAPTSPWSPGAGIESWTVSIPRDLAPGPDSPWSGLPLVEATINPWAHARAVSVCPLEQLPAGPRSSSPLPLFLDHNRMAKSLIQENRYPPLNALLAAPGGASGEVDAAIASALFRPPAQQPVPGVATFFNVVIGLTGYVFARPEGRGPRVGPPVGPEAFRPIQCLYR